MSVMQDTQYHRVAVLLPERVDLGGRRIIKKWKQLRPYPPVSA